MVIDVLHTGLEFAIGAAVLALALGHANLVFEAEPRLVGVITRIVD